MKKNIIKAILICLIFLLSLCIIILIKHKNSFVKEGADNIVLVEDNNKIDAETFYSIEKIVQNYINAINNEEYGIVYDMMAESFIKDKEIYIDNIQEYITNTEGISKVWILNINKIEEQEYIEGYEVYALLTDSSKKIEKEIYLEFYIDKINITFSIIPKSKFEKYNNNMEGNIEENGNNTYVYEKVDDKYVLDKYIQFYRYNTIANPERAYNLLEEEYRIKRFTNLEGYIKYLEENPLSNVQEFARYSKKENKDYIEYVCINILDEYYIFREKSMMEFKIMLDTYTLDLQEFLDKYNSTDDQGKVALNIQKFMQAIDSKDYNYAYNCLSDGFKSNYFKTLEDFEKYINENLYNNNEIEYKEFKEEGGLYKYTINIINVDDTNQIIEKTIIMKLNEGTDFEMSFNID